MSNNQTLHKNIIYTFVFGIYWGLVEIFLDWIFQYSNLYVRGIIHSSAAVFILLFAKRFANYNYSLLFVALIALIVKSAYKGAEINFIIALFAQAFIAEIILFFLKEKIAAVLTGGFILLYSFIHSLVFHGSLPGNYITYLYTHLFSGLTGISIPKSSYYLILLLFGVISFLIGILVGWLSFLVIKSAQKKIEASIKI